MNALQANHSARGPRPRLGSRHGSVLIIVVCALIALQLAVVGVVYLGARDQEVLVLRLQSSRAKYAADSGMNMALKELYDNVDLDGDGGIGTISNNGNAGNDPTISNAQVTVVPVAASTGQKFSVQGRSGTSRCWYELWVQSVAASIEGFESYNVGAALNNIGGWAGWDSNSGAVGYATNVRARTGVMCQDIISTSDSVHQYTPTSGRWTYTAWQYIPSTATGSDTYFILMNTYVVGGAKSWSTQIHFNLTNNKLYDDAVGGVTGVKLPIVFNQWVPIVADIDLDVGTQTVTYNGTLLFSASWNRSGGVRSIAAVDLDGSTIDHVYYDDIQLAPFGGSRPKVVQWMEVAPTP